MSSESRATNPAPRLSTEVSRNHIACNLCGENDLLPFCPENGRGLVQCNNCGMVYVSPRPEARELFALYGETYFRNDDSGEVGYTDYLKDEGNIRKTFARRLKRLERFVRPGTVLDVGCAAGFLLSEAEKRGWAVQGQDVSAYAVGYVEDRFGYPVQHGDLTTLDYPEGQIDLVTMWDVIEHVPDPRAYVEKVAILLRPGGVFSLATPDVDSFPARLTGKRWVGYKLSEEHVYYFSVKTLRQMLDEAGFDVIDVYHVGKYVTVRLFLDRLGIYSPLLGRILEVFERVFKLSERSVYVNPFDIVAITARKRG